MRHKNMIVCVFLLLLVLVLPTNTQAAEGGCGDGVSWTLDSVGTLTITGSGPTDNWTSDSAPWNSYKKSIKAVVIGQGVTSIGTSAFEGCTNLETVTLSSTVEAVGSYGFFGCTGLSGVYITDLAAWCGMEFADYSSSPMYYAKALYIDGQPVSGALQIPQGVTEIAMYAFYYCDGITSVAVPDTVRTMGSYAFAYCTGLQTATLGQGLGQISSSAFAYCTGLQTVAAGGISAVGDYAFRGCTGLRSAVLPHGLETIGHRAFEECTALETVSFPEGLTQIGTYGFYGCSSLKQVILPDTLTVIGDYTFRGCSGITELILPDKLTTIGKYAFYGCSGLTALTIPGDVATVGSHAFQNCTGLTTIRFCAVNMQDLSSGNYVFYKAGQNGAGIKLTVDAQVQKLPAYLFYPYSTYAPKLISVEFEAGSSCATIGKYAFSGCKTLTDLYFKDAAPAVDTNAFKDMSARVWYPGVETGWEKVANQDYGGSLTWMGYTALVEDGTGRFFPSIEAAGAGYVKLHSHGVAAAVLSQELYINLNGYTLTGVIQTNGHKIYGMDSTTDGYGGAGAGSFRCVDENGGEIVPQTYCKYDTKRYLTVQDTNGYSFHRFYLGITHMNLKPNTDGVGFKAVFCGDESVKSRLDSYGYSLQLGSFLPVTVSKDADTLVSGQTVTLRVDGFNGEVYGETPLDGVVFVQLKDGTIIESSTCTMTLRGLLEQLNHMADRLSQIQLEAVAAFIKRHPHVVGWRVEKLV